ncbi:hypothetical protein BKA65DRAFT_79589 [Rhexocercosporidium sp. MPI-PUGE-AT-0058]|nr:hypothetical protein BKA65DRAFT_79589 [Rhexocercosporidium sp. MPI-PUGE-AT-0058]
MPLITEMPRGRETVEAFTDPSPLSLHTKGTEGVSCVRAEQDQNQDCHRGFDEENFGEFDQDECLDSDMEGSILHRPRPKKVVKAPVLPQRSEKRVSRILDNVMLELQNIDGSRTKEEDMSRMDQEDPHELYLSSEEDASLSDDYEDSDSLLDFEETYSEDEHGGASASRASSRRSQEITAKVVSFMVVKPHIIEIHIPSSHTAPATPADEKPDSMDAVPAITTKAPSPAPQLRPTMRRPPPLNLQNARPMSMATTSYIPSSYTPAMPSNASMINLPSTSSHPVRKSSRLASLVTSTKASLSARSSTFSASLSASATSTHSFLDLDPFAQSANHTLPPLTPTDLATPITPKTPTSQSSAWKKSLSRTLSKARKPSLQKLNAAYNTSLSSSSFTSSNSNSHRASTMSSATMPTLSRISSNPEPTTPTLFSHNTENNEYSNTFQDRHQNTESRNENGDRIVEVPVRRAETMPVTPSPREAPLRYEDLMRNRVPPPIPDTASQHMPREGRKSFSLGMGMGIGLGRRKSVKRAS